MKNTLVTLKSYVASHKLHSICILLILVAFWIGYSAVHHREISFSYAGDNCFRDMVPLPGLQKNSETKEFKLVHANIKSVFGISLLSTSSCVVPQAAVNEASSSVIGLKIFGLPSLGKQYVVTTDNHPEVDNESLGARISVREDLVLKLDKTDKTFNYQIRSDSGVVDCLPQGLNLKCDIDKLKLHQNKKYQLSVIRLFNDKEVGTILSKNIQTTDPINISDVSVKNESTVYGIPKTITIKASRDLNNASISINSIPQTVSISGRVAIIKLNKDLPRRKKFKLEVNELVAKDKGLLLKPVAVNFSTSGGPKVSSSNLGTRSFTSGKSVIFNFDQKIKGKQDLDKLISVRVRGKSVPVSFKISEKSITITPKTNWGLCVPFAVSISDDVVSKYGISGDSEWSRSSRTTCYVVRSIGSSAEGESINSWRFGSGDKKVLFVGATHGNERSTKYLMEAWIKELDSNPSKIPSDQTIIIVPSLNPDGVEGIKRVNSNGVDLNRNFPANDWKSNVTMPGRSTPVKNGAGKKPLSEPESMALYNLVIRESPDLVLTYHSTASVVSGNDSGYSNRLARAYARSSGYRYLPVSDTNEVFQYDTTGAFETWLHDKLRTPAILVELGSDRYSQFEKNKAALWLMVDSI